MKFPRNARIFRGQLDAAPFAAVLFLLVLFLMLGSLMYTPGVRLELPIADDLPAIGKPSLAVAIDSGGRYYFNNQLIGEKQLSNELRKAATETESPVLIVHADRSATTEMLVRVSMLARSVGITNSVLAVRPRPQPIRAAKAMP